MVKESALIIKSKAFALDVLKVCKEFEQLLNQCKTAHDQTLTESSLKKTVKLRDFKAAGTKGIQQCKIRSVILPLLADHVLREANHYIRLLKN